MTMGSHVSKSYWTSRQFKSECEFRDGKRHGPYKLYYKHGPLILKCEYRDGVRHGPYEEYYYDGQVCEKCEYRDGERHGPYERYYDNGQICEQCEYRYGVKVVVPVRVNSSKTTDTCMICLEDIHTVSTCCEKHVCKECLQEWVDNSPKNPCPIRCGK